jgi:hypothetical protein
MSAFSDIPIRSNADTSLVDASWWNTIRAALISAFPGGGKKVTGSEADPIEITAAGGITAAGSDDEVHFIEGSGGAVEITADPPISAGARAGDRLTLIGQDNTNTVTIDLGAGPCVLGQDCILECIYTGSKWLERSRSMVASGGGGF